MGLPKSQNSTICLTVQRYDGPDGSQYAAGWRLNIFPDRYSSPLARHKTLNYLYHLAARQFALDAGYDEAIILDAHGKVAETAAGSLLVRAGGRWSRPASFHQLAGTTVLQVSGLLEELGETVSVRDLGPEDIAAADSVWVCNSLMGIMAVTEIEGRPLPTVLSDLASGLREDLFQRGRGQGYAVETRHGVWLQPHGGP